MNTFYMLSIFPEYMIGFGDANMNQCSRTVEMVIHTIKVIIMQ